jgi:hypothetical protein
MLCKQVREEEGVRDQFLASLADTRAEIAALAALLGTDAPEEPKGNAQSSSSSSSEGGRSGGQLNLTEQLAHLECHVDQLRSQKEVSSGQLQCFELCGGCVW